MSTNDKEFNLATATARSLKTYAANNLDLKLSLSMSETTMRERIIARCNELQIPAPKAELVVKKARKTSQDYYTINIPKQDKPGGDEPAFVGVQAVGYLIPRNIDVDVPASVVEVLRNGVQDIVTQEEDGDLAIDKVPTYPFQIVKKVEREAA